MFQSASATGAWPDVDDAVARAVHAGLGARPKRLPPWLLYDAQGSALFEEITRLPEYYLTRTERAILAAHADEMIAAAGPSLSLVELGAGSATKTRLLIEAALRRQPRALYVPVDVSPAALATATAHLGAGLPGLKLRPVVARYPEQLSWLGDVPPRRLVIFLGSNLGNYEPAEAVALLSAVAERLEPGDALLVGTDLRKSPELLLPAYDDAAGVTARFSLNLLARINRELGGGFDTGGFRHLARWNDHASRVELYLESAAAQVVPIRALGVEARFAAGERLHTENSYKFTVDGVRALLSAAGLRLEATWTDPRRWFAVHLGRRG
jgi:dimethylhistidine N-methyltransferase